MMEEVIVDVEGSNEDPEGSLEEESNELNPDKYEESSQKFKNIPTEKSSTSSSEQGDEVDMEFAQKSPHSFEIEHNLPEISLPNQDDYDCLTARTALLMPFKWSHPTEADLRHYINELLKRKIRTETGKKIRLYKENKALPDAVADLDPHFSQTLGWNETNFQSKDKDDVSFEPYDSGISVTVDEVCRRVVVSPEALEVLFPNPGLVTNSIKQKITVEEIEIIGFPLGTAVLKIILNWIPGEQGLRIDHFRSWLYLSKFRQKVENFDGWLLDCEPEGKVHSKKQKKSLGDYMMKALWLGQPITLNGIGNWLLLKKGEDPNRPPRRLGFAKRCYHHTVVVIDRKPNERLLKEYLFHLKRAYGQKNRPPPLSTDEMGTTDRVLRPRSNRYIGMSREGTVSLSWPSKRLGIEDYEVRKWHKVFLGIYLILAIQIQGEKAMLLELSNLSAHAGTLLKEMHTDTSSLPRIRADLGSLAALMTRYTLQMSNDDCGGLSEYVEFFTTQRTIFGIRTQRSELREEIQDVLALVESTYLEEQRKFSRIVALQNQEEKKRSKKRDEKISASQARFQNIVGIISTFTLPVVILGSLFGMNLKDLPVDVPFYPALGATLTLSLILALAFSFVMYYTDKKNKDKATTDAVPIRSSLSLELDRYKEMERLSMSFERPSFDGRNFQTI
eukprot:TRINITY_DN14775_c0_g1_i1.p1 TRINITY_DN14775_c0_g1~~TRINITY_DN14775_c0_g1_i1.p1  ORF type:complete len:673 (-),score=197.88 TRINITY_DN14775_c0_g1_i1:130-2148(-)